VPTTSCPTPRPITVYVNATIAYEPETSWNYEVGTHLNLFGNKVQFDLAAIYMQIKNQRSRRCRQLRFGRMMTNAGKSYSCGIEAMLRAARCR
jgi:outer membrane receptor for monomeric catechols